jgi:hypothetical protein
MKRQLCYRHHCQEFDKLANHNRYLAAEWRTVPESECELCTPACIICRAPLEDRPDGLYCPNCGTVEQ